MCELIFIFKKLVTKGKKEDGERRSQVANNVRYEDLSSYVLVPTDGAQEAQEESTALSHVDGANADTKNYEHLEHLNRTHNKRKEVTLNPTNSLAGTSHYVSRLGTTRDHDFAVSDAVPNYSVVNTNTCTSLLNVMDDVEDENLGCKVDSTCQKNTNLLDDESKRNFDIFPVSVSILPRIGAHSYVYPLDVEAKDRTKATGAIPKMPLLENKKADGASQMVKFPDGVCPPRVYSVSDVSTEEMGRQTDSLDDQSSIDVDVSMQSPIPCNDLTSSVVSRVSPNKGETMVAGEMKTDEQLRQDESKLDDDFQPYIQPSQVHVPRTDPANRGYATTVRTIADMDNGMIKNSTSESDSPDVKQLLTSAQLQMKNLQSHKQVTIQRRNQTPLETSRRPIQPIRRQEALLRPVKTSLDKESSARRKQNRTPKPVDRRSESTQSGSASTKRRQRSCTSSSSSSDTIKSQEYKSKSKGKRLEEISVKKQKPRLTKAKKKSQDGTSKSPDMQFMRSVSRVNEPARLPVRKQPPKPVQHETNEKAQEEETPAEKTDSKAKRSREVEKKNKAALRTKKRGTATRINVVISEEAAKEKAVIEDYLKNLLPVKMSFELIDINPTNPKNLTVILEFESANQARQAVTSFRKTSSKTKVKAHFMKKEITLEKEEATMFLDKQREDVMQKGIALIEKHQMKIDEMQVQVDNLKVKKHIPLHMYDTIRIEREAVESKLEELKLQKEEFTSRHKLILDRLQSPEMHSNPKDEVNKLRLLFGQECLKLTTALPIYARRRHIIDVVRENPVSVILGETGSGKSTQLVQYIHQAQTVELGENVTKMIVCTQPRKVAAQSLAKHVADEMGTNCGGVVGYKTGFQSNFSSKTKIVFTTDHTLLNECLKDPTLQKYSCIIIDEAHERSIYTDLLLGMIKKCLIVRNDLRVIVTSATIDPEIFVKYFGGAPVLRVSGRMFPVDVVYNNPADPSREDYLQESVEKVKEIHQQEPEGDILVFLTSPLETQKACERVGAINGLVCLPLHGQLQAREQQLVFEPVPLGQRKVVFATNSAETSITIPGIKYVVDTGRVKEKVFDAKKNMSGLVVKSISKSSAEQRKGRAGRMSSGKCYRLFTEEDFKAMEPISLPEILRVHLGQALLKLMEIGIADPLSFDFVQSPSTGALQSAMKILKDLQAVSEQGITDLGKRMAMLPVEPRMAKVIFDAISRGCGLEGIAVAALSTVTGGIFYRMGTEEDKKQADYFKTKFCQGEGDIHTFLHVYKEWNSVSEKQKSEWCFRNYINGKSIRACRETVQEITKILSKDLGIKVEYNFVKDSKCTSLSTILLDCFRSNIGYFTGHSKCGYFVVNDADERFLQIHPSSSLSYLASTPKWVVYLDVLKTSNDYMLNVVVVDGGEIQKKIDSGDLHVDQCRLDEVTLKECVVAEVGSSLMSLLIGPRFQKLKSMEKELSQKYSRPVILDVQRNRSQMKAFTIKKFFGEIKKYLGERTAPERHKMKKEIMQIPVTDNSNTRAVLEAGGQCSDILMPDETRTLLLRNVPDGWIDAHVELEMQGYGEVTDIQPYIKKGYGANKTWGKITFRDSTAAQFALENYPGHMLLVPDGISKTAQSKNELKVRIQWCRRPTRGFAFVRPQDPEDVMLLTGHRKVIKGSIVTIKVAKDDPTKLFVTNLSKDTTEDDVRNVLSQSVPIDTVFIPRQKVGETQPEMLQALTGRINMEIMQFAERDEFSVKLIPPKPASFDFFGYIFFSNPETGLTAINRLHGSLFDGQRLSVCAELRTSLHVQRNIYAALKLQLDATIEGLKRNNRSAKINVKELKSGHFAVNLEADEVDAMSNIRNTLQEIISGHRIECQAKEEEQALFSHAGRDLLTQLQTRLVLYVRVDTRLRTVTIYGERENVEEAQDEIKRFLTRFRNLKSEEISLKGDGRPPGLMKHLLIEHGLEMESLRRKSGVNMLSLILQKHILKATGSRDTLEKLTEAITAAAMKLQENAIISLPDDVDCTVCFCPIDGSVYRLEYCGHPYCSECIVGLIKNGISGNEYPICCAEENCQHPLVWKDFNKKLGPEQRQELVRSSTDGFVAKNSNMFKFCNSPDCPVMYRIGYNEGAPYLCTGCGVTICTRCHVQYHYGLTCAMYKSKLRTSDYDLEAWVQEKPSNRALCPGCKAPIEKDGGCSHMHCVQCKIHICWWCKRTFKLAIDTYNHQASCDKIGVF